MDHKAAVPQRKHPSTLFYPNLEVDKDVLSFMLPPRCCGLGPHRKNNPAEFSEVNSNFISDPWVNGNSDFRAEVWN